MTESMATPTYAGRDQRMELLLGVLACVQLPLSYPSKTLPRALPLPGPVAAPQPCTLETRGTGVSATQ